MDTAQRKDVKGEERVRGPGLTIFVKRANGIPFKKAFERVESGNGVFPSNKRLDKTLVGSDEWQKIREVFACWSGTMTGYKEPGEKLGKSVVYTDPETNQRYVFPVPENYKGAKNSILVVEHPDYTLESGKKEVIERIQDLNRIILPEDITEGDLVVAISNLENLSLIENFPTSDGWYLTDEKHGIPTGDKVNSSNDDARHLWRIGDGSRVGPVARGYVYDYDYNNGRFVDLNVRPSNSLGVAVEAPAGSAPKTEAIPTTVSSAQESNEISAADIERLFKENTVTLKIKGISAEEVKTLLTKFGEDLGKLGEVAKEELLASAKKLEAVLRCAELKE